MNVPEFWQAVYIASISSHKELANRHTISIKMDEAKILADQAVKDYKGSEFYLKTEDELIREDIELQDDIDCAIEKLEEEARVEVYIKKQKRIKRLFNMIFFWRKKA